MSWQACAWADSLEHNTVGPLAFRVLVKLANVSNELGTVAWRSKADIAAELGVSQRSIQRAYAELEHAALIKPSDQSFVHHLRADKRPTVYELNFRFKSQFAQPELPWENGETRLSTGSRGDTPGASGETTAVAQGTIIKQSRESTRGNHTAPVSPLLGRCRNGHPNIDTSSSGIAFCALGCAPALTLVGADS